MMFLKRINVLVVGVLMALSLLFAPLAAAVDCNSSTLSAKEAIQCGANGANGGASQTPKEASDNLNHVLTTVINIFSVIVGVAAVIMIVMAGFRYITSGGSQEKVTSAKNTIMYAVIGLIVVALAQVIVQFVLEKATQPPASASSGSSSSSSGRTGGGVGERPN